MTYVLIAINVLVFVGTSWRRRPVDVDLGDDRHDVALSGPLGVAEGDWWRLVTGGFLHAGCIHIALQHVLPYLLGTMLEPALGHVRFAALYFVSLLAGSLGALLLGSTALTVGASGAVFGLMAAAFIVQRARGIDPMAVRPRPADPAQPRLTFIFPGLNISIGGHIGGLIGGAIAALAIERLCALRRGDLLQGARVRGRRPPSRAPARSR